MKILFYIWSLTVGGAERHTLDLAAGLRRKGFDTAVLVHHGDISPDLQVDPVLPVILLHAGGFANLSGWREAWRAIARFDCDVLVSVNQSATCGAMAGNVFLRRPQAFVFHSTLLPRTIDQLKMGFIRRLGGKLTVIFCSRNQQSYWQGRGFARRQSIAIPNGVDTTRFEPVTTDMRRKARLMLNLEDEDYVVCMLAAFRPEKNHTAFVSAVARLRAQGLPIKALLVGDGALKERLQAQTKALRIEQHVIFAGQHADVRPFLAASDIGVLPSVAVETFSLAALETMATGLPMIMTTIGGASEIVTHEENGLLIPPGDDGALTDALERAADRSTRIAWGEQARQSVVSRYSNKVMLERYADIFVQIGRRSTA